MPIYAYRCDACGHAKDVLQKVSDPVLTVCPSCGAEAFRKQVTAAGFQLKGSGWYVTDFRGGKDTKPSKPNDEGGSATEAAKSDAPRADAPKADAPKAEGGAAAPAASTPAAPATPSSGSSSQ